MESGQDSVIIIGGGVSGLFAALKLAENSHKNVTVLEADSLFGGRVRSLPFNDGVIELGAQWIHGRGECPLWKFVNDNQIPVTSDESGDGDGTFYLQGGKLMPEDVLDDCEEFSEKLHWHLNKFYERRTLNSVDLPASVGHFFEEEIRKFLANETDEDKLILKTGFCDWFWKWELVDTGVSDLKKQSVKSWIEYVDYEMETKFDEGEPILEGGYSKLVEFLTTSLTGRVSLQTNSAVTKVSWEEDTRIQVEMAGGEVISADYVVLALPLGVLKHSHRDIFSPALPKEKIEVIEQLEFGLMNKIFLEFEEIFWDPNNPGIQFIMTDTESSEGDLSDTWWHNIAGFDAVAGQPRVLCGWISGEAAACLEKLSDDEVLVACHKLLQGYVGDHVPAPVTCHVTRWGSETHIRGSYSYSTPECDLRNIGPSDLATPVLDDKGRKRLFFCGEASDTEHYGTVTGAMVSGCREGLRLANILASG